MKGKIPDFIIVGAMKAGTTSLLHHLNNHEEIYAPSSEIHFFNNDDNFNKGIQWYKNKLSEGYNHRVEKIGEKTPTYSYQENVPGRISKFFPNTKLIWVFRNPVDRTYSNYLHAYKQGSETLSFEEALDKEEKRVQENIFKGYKKRSVYHEQVSRFLKFFPIENMYFLTLEDLKKPYTEKHVLNNLFAFLDLSAEGFIFKDRPKNITKLPTYPMILYYARKSKLYKSWSFRYLVKKVAFLNAKSGYPKMKDQIRTELIEYFKPHNNKLADMIDQDLTIWNK